MELLPTEKEVHDYDPCEGECCEIINFRPDLRQQPRSVYNQSVARVFAKGLKTRQKYSDMDAQLIERKFLAHLRNLQQMFKAKIKPEKKQSHRRDQRKREV